MAVLAIVATAAGATPSRAAFPDTSVCSQYLLVGMGPQNSQGGQPGIGTAVAVSNFEIGANKAPVPSTSSFLDSGGGPSLLGTVPNIPLAALPVSSGICADGNVAVTSSDRVYDFQNVGVYADLGIHARQSPSGADDGTSNSFYNDPPSGSATGGKAI